MKKEGCVGVAPVAGVVGEGGDPRVCGEVRGVGRVVYGVLRRGTAHLAVMMEKLRRHCGLRGGAEECDPGVEGAGHGGVVAVLVSGVVEG